MVGPIIKSALKAGIEKLPDVNIAAQSVSNVLKKKGIKAEELKYSGIKLPTEGKINKEGLAKLEANRLDEFGETVIQDGAYKTVSLPDGKANPSYRENVYTFSDTKQVSLLDQIAGDLPPADRYASQHFEQVPNYLMHTRTYRGTIAGKQTRVVQEIQSDLHQAGRQRGYVGEKPDAAANVTEIEKSLAAYKDAGNFWYPENGVSAATSEADAIAKQNKAVEDLKYYWSDMPETTDLADYTAAEIVEKAKTSTGVPESPYKSSWLAKGMEREIAKAVDKGDEQIAIPIKGAVQSLKRGKGVQKWYEDKVVNTVKKIAKANNMDFKLVTEGGEVADNTDAALTFMRVKSNAMGNQEEQLFASITEQYPNLKPTDLVTLAKAQSVADVKKVLDSVGLDTKVEYAVITPKPGVRPEFSLYSVEVGGLMLAYEASKEGYTEEQISTELIKRGYTKEEAASTSTQAAEAVAGGFTKEQVEAHVSELEPTLEGEQEEHPEPVVPPKEGSVLGDAYRELIGADQLSPKDLVKHLEVIAPNTSFMTTNIAGFFGNQEAARQAAEAASAAETQVLALLEARGVTAKVENGSYLVQNAEGQWEGAAPGFWKTLGSATGELTGAIGGAIAGGRLGLGLTAAIPVPGARLAGLAIGSVAGAVMGSVAGTELDYLRSAVTLSEDMNAEVAASKALTAAEASIVGDAIGLGVFKIAGKGWNAIVKTKQLIKNGGFSRAKTALKEHFFITDDEAEALVTKLSQVANVPGKTKTEREIAATMVTQPGGEGLVRASVALDPKASAAVSKAIDDRAQDLLAATARVGDSNVGRLLKGELEAYTSVVKSNYARVKELAATAPRANNFSFDYDKLTLEPVLSRLSNNIDNPDVAYKFAKQASKIRDMSSTRSFADLLELRSLVNEFKYNKRIRSAKDFDMLNAVLTNIDGGIREAAEATMDNPGQWLADFASAKGNYSKMKQLEKNALMRVVGRPGINEDVIAKAVAKYAYALDDTFVEAMAVLPRKTRVKVEGTVLDNLANKYTAGIEGGQRATHFPMLAKQLEGVTFSSPEARTTKKAIMQLADVFRNDVPLAQATGQIQIPTFQSFLTADPVIRAKFEIASSVFNTIKSMAPGSKARTLQLVKKTAEVLENPVHAKSIKELRKALQGEVDIQPMLEELAAAAAKRKAATGIPGMPKVIMYGDNAVLKTKGKGSKQLIPMHRIASLEDVAQIAEVTGINQADRKAIDMALHDRGYSAVQLGADSVRRIKNVD